MVAVVAVVAATTVRAPAATVGMGSIAATVAAGFADVLIMSFH